ncbi:hypothetical protein LIER_25080 [Lithospermum erythrorhizon]|uniref:WAT1-related protein n=1 Tax=Lithospermum erythrorhizon TaxID=34254 RepID=A0AAV3R4W4_LITER
MGQSNSVCMKLKLILALLALQLCFTGFSIVSRIALNMGISKIVYPVYRNILALLIIGPVAYFLEKKERPPLTFSLLVQFFFLAFLGITANQGFYILGLYYASPTFASAIQNSVPAITFVMAAAMRIEKVNFVRVDGLAKIFGTVVCVGGATIITLYKGPPLLTAKAPGDGSVIEDVSAMPVENWTLGCIYILGQCLSWAAWMVLQAPVIKKYPAKLSLTSFTCFFGLIQFLIIAAFFERDPEHWKIHSWEEILSIVYAGIVASGIVIALQIWCIQKGGPVYVAVFQPVQTVLVAIAAYLILGDQIYTGGIMGAALIMVGLYMVLWGKTEEKRVEIREMEDPLNKHLLDGNNKDRGCSAIGTEIP